MPKVFNSTGVCIPDLHYMVDMSASLREIKELVDSGKYFTINRARQYGKTTILRALYHYLQSDYYVVLIDFQTFDQEKFENGNRFSVTFAHSFLRALKRNPLSADELFFENCEVLKRNANVQNVFFSLKELFEEFGDICEAYDKPLVMIIDELDSATNN